MNHSNNQPQDRDLPVELANPARRALVQTGYTHLEQLANASPAELIRLHGIGPKALDQLRLALAELGLSLAGEQD